MGRNKSDSPTVFPWDKIFSNDINTVNQGLEYCKSEHNGSDTLKRAVTAIGSGYNSGSKPVLCDRIKIKAEQIRYQINKATEGKEKLRNEVIEFYRQTFLKKFEGKEPGIINIVIPPRPILPILTEQEKRRYSSPPSSPPSSPRSRQEPQIEIDDEIILPAPQSVKKQDINDGVLLSARAILYYKNSPLVNGKKSLSAKEFYEQLLVLYTGIVPEDSPLLNKESIKSEIKQIPELIKSSGGSLKKETIDKAEAVVKKSEKMSKYKKAQLAVEIPPIEEEEIIPIIDIVKKPIEYKTTVTEDDIMNYIKTKGWEEPTYKTKEALCDYMLTKIKSEDVKSEAEYNSIQDRINNLSSELITLIDMHEERIKNLEKVKKGKKVTFGPSQVKIIENEVEEIQEQIHDVKEKLQEAKDNKEEIVQNIEEKKQMCFKMRQWLDQDEFDRVSVEKDLGCDTGVCNVDSGVCEPEIQGEYTSSVGISKIKGSKNLVDRMTGKYNTVLIEEEIIPVIKQKKPKVPLEILREQIKLILSTSDLNTVTSKDVRNQLSSIFKVKFDKRKEEIDAVTIEEIEKLLKHEEPVVEIPDIEEPVVEEIPDIEEEPVVEEPIVEIPDIEEELIEEEPIVEITEQQIVEKTVEFLEQAGKKINEREIRAKVASHFNIEIDPYKKLIKSTVKKYVEDIKSKRKRCNTLGDSEVDDEIRAKDLMCDEGDACNLDESRCDPIEELKEPVEEITIGGMLVKVSGKNKIIEALRQKIIKSGGAIPVVEIPEEPLKEEKPLEKVIEESEEANDMFQSSLPGVRINLEDLVKNIKTITSNQGITSAQNKIKSAERKCIERIAKCAGIKI